MIYQCAALIAQEQELCATQMPKTKVFQAKEGSNSMKGTIPSDVVSALHLKHKDKIEWSIDVADGKIIAKITKVDQV